MTDLGMSGPILALIGWTFVMWVWLYATRIPAMRAAKIDPQKVVDSGGKLELPPKVTRVADNYNHLHEQPTVFYALAIVTEIVGAADTISVQLAWLYVLLRVLHSLVQATANIVIIRWAVFNIATLVLLAIFVRTVLALT